jgi:hypothetical protein
MNILNTLVSFEKYTKEEAIFILWKNAKTIIKMFDNEDEDEVKNNIRHIISNCKKEKYIDYLSGRSLKIEVFETWPLIDSTLYNRDNGENLMQNIVNKNIVNKNNFIDKMAINNNIANEAKLLYDELF